MNESTWTERWVCVAMAIFSGARFIIIKTSCNESKSFERRRMTLYGLFHVVKIETVCTRMNTIDDIGNFCHINYVSIYYVEVEVMVSVAERIKATACTRDEHFRYPFANKPNDAEFTPN